MTPERLNHIREVLASHPGANGAYAFAHELLAEHDDMQRRLTACINTNRILLAACTTAYAQEQMEEVCRKILKRAIGLGEEE